MSLLHCIMPLESGSLIGYHLPLVADVNVSIKERKSLGHVILKTGCLQLGALKRVLTILI